MERKPWQRKIECSECGDILRVFNEDIESTCKRLSVEPFYLYTYFVSCDGCGHVIDLKELPAHIEDIARTKLKYTV